MIDYSCKRQWNIKFSDKYIVNFEEVRFKISGRRFSNYIQYLFVLFFFFALFEKWADMIDRLHSIWLVSKCLHIKGMFTQADASIILL